MKVRYTKWDGRLHWHFDLEELGKDGHGLWLHAQRGRRIQRGDEPPLAEPYGFVCLVPTTGCWIAYFLLGGDQAIYIDVTTSPVRREQTVEAVDLDLDVIRWRDGRVTLEDEDEFEEHQTLFGYPAGVVVAARATADRLFRDVAAFDEPFDQAATPWVAAAQGSGYPGTRDGRARE